MKKINMKNVTAGTVARTIVLLIALINMGLGMLGYTQLDIDENTIYTACSGIATIGAAVVACWKNNSYTEGAQEADKVMKEIKRKLVDDGEVV